MDFGRCTVLILKVALFPKQFADCGSVVFQDIEYPQRYMALAAYQAVETGEVSLSEGDMIELIRMGSEGWWLVRNLATGRQGWTPANYLDCLKRSSTYSTQSTVSSGSSGKVN